VLLCICAFSQSKSLEAVKAEQAPVIDGQLADEIWSKATEATGFIQKFPNYGAASLVKPALKYCMTIRLFTLVPIYMTTLL
jgi:hypothetical protein